MVKKVLPPLDTKNQIANLAAPGEWKVEDATFLEKLAKGLKLGGQEEVSSSDIYSIPDVWARVLLVRNGIIDNNKFLINESFFFITNIELDISHKATKLIGLFKL